MLINLYISRPTYRFTLFFAPAVWQLLLNEYEYEYARPDLAGGRLESPSILTKKNSFLPGHWGPGPLGPPCLRQCSYVARETAALNDTSAWQDAIKEAANNAIAADSCCRYGQFYGHLCQFSEKCVYKNYYCWPIFDVIIQKNKRTLLRHVTYCINYS